jgi:hypothetical protein
MVSRRTAGVCEGPPRVFFANGGCPLGILVGEIEQHPGIRPGRDNATLTEPACSQESCLKTRMPSPAKRPDKRVRAAFPPRQSWSSPRGQVHVIDCRHSDVRSGAVLGGVFVMNKKNALNNRINVENSYPCFLFASRFVSYLVLFLT